MGSKNIYFRTSLKFERYKFTLLITFRRHAIESNIGFFVYTYLYSHSSLSPGIIPAPTVHPTL